MHVQICRCGTATLVTGQCPHCDRGTQCLGSAPGRGLSGPVPEPCPVCVRRDSVCVVCKMDRGSVADAAACEQICRTAEARQQI